MGDEFKNPDKDMENAALVIQQKYREKQTRTKSKQ
jgi:hypothetical protein